MTKVGADQSTTLTGGRLLARNAVWNLLGNGAPLLVAIFCIPILIRELGTDRFGVLTLSWAVIGYASLFDLGLGRAVTQLVAKKIGTGDWQEVPAIAWTSLLLMFSLGLIGTVVVVGVSPWLVQRVLHVPNGLERETLHSFYLLGLSVPIVVTTAGLRGLLEAQQRFGMVNTLRLPIGIFTFLGPLLVLPFSKSLTAVVAVLVVARLVGGIAHIFMCLKAMPSLAAAIAWKNETVGPLLRFGGWMTVTNVIGPLMVTMDRFLIGALLSVGAVAYYATPYEVVTKLWLIPTAVLGVMFPAFSTSFVQDANRTALLYYRSLKCVLLSIFPLILIVVVFAPDGLRLWLGAEFAQQSTRVLQWLAVGVLINSLAQVPFAVLQGTGRPDLTAKLHLIELPTYLLALWTLTKTYGIVGAAIAWTGRVALDALILFVMARRLLPMATSPMLRAFLVASPVLVMLASVTFAQSLAFKATLLGLALLLFVVFAWFLLLSPEERSLGLEHL